MELIMKTVDKHSNLLWQQSMIVTKKIRLFLLPWILNGNSLWNDKKHEKMEERQILWCWCYLQEGNFSRAEYGILKNINENKWIHAFGSCHYQNKTILHDNSYLPLELHIELYPGATCLSRVMEPICGCSFIATHFIAGCQDFFMQKLRLLHCSWRKTRKNNRFWTCSMMLVTDFLACECMQLVDKNDYHPKVFSKLVAECMEQWKCESVGLFHGETNSQNAFLGWVTGIQRI